MYFKLNQLVLIAVLLSFFACNEKEKNTAIEAPIKKPNIVLIVSDDHGQGDLGCYGNKTIKTPSLDKLASQGIRFTQAYCPSASCSASRSVILTGLYNHANGQYGHGHHYHHFSAFSSVKSLPVLLQELGAYKTARIGKYHVDPEEVFHFETTLKANARNTVAMADSCKSYLENNKEHPFFLYFCTDDPHRAGSLTNEPLAPNSFGNKLEGYENVNETSFLPEEVEVPSYLPNSKACRAELAQYYQSVARMDQGIGKLFQHLKDAGVWNNTLIVYISDNGIAFEGAKTNQYQPALNLPCIIKRPNSEEKKSVVDALISWVDITPTLLDYAGVLPKANEVLKSNYEIHKNDWDNTYTDGFHGRSFKNILQGDDTAEWNETYASHTFHEVSMYYPMRTVITRNYKLIWNLTWQLPYPQAQDLWSSSTWQSALKNKEQNYGKRTIQSIKQRPEFELYSLVNDPDEINNLAYHANYKTVLDSLKTKIYKFQERTNDPWIYIWERKNY